jgi:hypothetical protein
MLPDNTGGLSNIRKNFWPTSGALWACDCAKPTIHFTATVAKLANWVESAHSKSSGVLDDMQMFIGFAMVGELRGQRRGAAVENRNGTQQHAACTD